MTDQSIYLSVRQAADLLSVSTRTIRRYIKQQYLPAYRVAGQPTIRIKREDVDALLEPIAAESSEDDIAGKGKHS
ncbi:MAG: helix-turn-helix domain-containing protein [Anaerolineae bacterium]|jgi:excisionase family DNA binding protein